MRRLTTDRKLEAQLQPRVDVNIIYFYKMIIFFGAYEDTYLIRYESCSLASSVLRRDSREARDCTAKQGA
jgi:hypothetical protein